MGIGKETNQYRMIGSEIDEIRANTSTAASIVLIEPKQQGKNFKCFQNGLMTFFESELMKTISALEFKITKTTGG